MSLEDIKIVNVKPLPIKIRNLEADLAEVLDIPIYDEKGGFTPEFTILSNILADCYKEGINDGINKSANRLKQISDVTGLLSYYQASKEIRQMAAGAGDLTEEP